MHKEAAKSHQNLQGTVTSRSSLLTPKRMLASVTLRLEPSRTRSTSWNPLNQVLTWVEPFSPQTVLFSFNKGEDST